MNKLLFSILFLSFYINSFSQQWVNDQNFYTGNGGNNSTGINHLMVDHQDRIIITGSFVTFNDTIVNRITRLKPNGGIDTSFHSGAGFDNFVYTLNEQLDGKILATGAFFSYDNVSTNKIVRLNVDGSLDTSFNIGTGTNDVIWKSIIQPDGKILISGDFTEFNGIPMNRIARLNSDGSIDTSFNIGTGANAGAGGMCLQPDGKIILTGQFTMFNNVSKKCIVRLNASGSIDNSFDANNNTYGTLGKVMLRSTGDIIVSGNFTEFDNVPMNGVVLLDANGQLNTQFSIGVFNDVQVRRSTLQSDDKLLVFGSFTSYNGVTYNRLMRFNTDGSVDTSFDLGAGADDWVQGVEMQSNGKMIVSGKFSHFMGESKNDLTRITFCSSSDTTIFETNCDSFNWSHNGITYTTSGQYSDTIPNVSGCDSIITLDLTIIPSLPLSVANSFAMPSDANTCVGEAAIDLSGNAPFELDFDNGSQVINSNGYSLITGLCAGIHDLHVTDNCGDTLSTAIVIPVDSNYVFNNPFIDSLALDSLGVAMTNCDIYYAGIDTAYIDSIWANGNTVNVIWNIVDSNGSNFDTTNYVLNNGNGVYWLQLSVFCPFKSANEYFTVTEAIYFNNGHVSTAGLSEEENLFKLYPNPATDQVHLSFLGSDAELTVYDVQGKVVLKDKVQNQGMVSLQNFERGVYLFNFRNSSGHSFQRVVKQ